MNKKKETNINSNALSTFWALMSAAAAFMLQGNILFVDTYTCSMAATLAVFAVVILLVSFFNNKGKRVISSIIVIGIIVTIVIWYKLQPLESSKHINNEIKKSIEDVELAEGNILFSKEIGQNKYFLSKTSNPYIRDNFGTDLWYVYSLLAQDGSIYQLIDWDNTDGFFFGNAGKWMEQAVAKEELFSVIQYNSDNINKFSAGDIIIWENSMFDPHYRDQSTHCVGYIDAVENDNLYLKTCNLVARDSGGSYKLISDNSSYLDDSYIEYALVTKGSKVELYKGDVEEAKFFTPTNEYLYEYQIVKIESCERDEEEFKFDDSNNNGKSYRYWYKIEDRKGRIGWIKMVSNNEIDVSNPYSKTNIIGLSDSNPFNTKNINTNGKLFHRGDFTLEYLKEIYSLKDEDIWIIHIK
ncbi:MAG TPA: hypothetical protein PLP35_09155 [Caldisericia bacterium]|nr:hypothetical protein [Caldisericia bacterium]HRV75668.1 hypothetical protein [Caldisericia bacterium]